jgi:hypothetical protein
MRAHSIRGRYNEGPTPRDVQVGMLEFELGPAVADATLAFCKAVGEPLDEVGAVPMAERTRLLNAAMNKLWELYYYAQPLRRRL